MRAAASKTGHDATTLLEILVVIVAIVLLILMLLPHFGGSRKGTTLPCLQNLHTAGVAFQLWAQDHTSRFPMQVSTNSGGTLELLEPGGAATQFKSLTPYLGPSPKLVCPADKTRKQPESGKLEIRDATISYFVGLDAAVSTTNAFLSGDRNLAIDAKPANSGLFSLTTNVAISWTRELHARRGIILFADTHAELTRTNLPSLVLRQNLGTNRLAIP